MSSVMGADFTSGAALKEAGRRTSGNILLPYAFYFHNETNEESWKEAHFLSKTIGICIWRALPLTKEKRRGSGVGGSIGKKQKGGLLLPFSEKPNKWETNTKEMIT